MNTAPAIRDELSEADVARYRTDGFLHTPGLLDAADVARLRELFLAESERQSDRAMGYAVPAIFLQQVNLWQANRDLLGLAQHPRMRRTATRLAGEPLRLWHDHLLVKKARNGVATEFHQDQPYWPHREADSAISAWVALVDVPLARGCMSYIPGSHRYTDLAAQDLLDPRSLFQRCPEMEWQPMVTVPVKAGDVVWHHCRTAHRANANATDQDRVVVSVIYMPRTTRFSGAGHVCTEDAGLQPGDMIEGDAFPDV